MTTFAVRFLLLLLLLAVVAALDYRKHRAAARKWREYGILLIGGAIGALFGAVNDVFITSRISPEYFIHGKGIAAGDGFSLRVAALGMQAGLAAGLIGMAVLLFVNTRRKLPLDRVLIASWRPLICAIAGGAIAPRILGRWDPFRFVFRLGPLMTPEQGEAFLFAWWVHIGIYVGCFVGLIWAAFAVHKGRQA